MKNNRQYGFNTRSVHAGYDEKPFGSTVPPIYQCTAYEYPDAATAAARFALEEPGFIYTRLGNPSVDILEKRVASLDAGAAAVAFASGHAAMFGLFSALCRAGDEIVSSINIYGGAINMMGVTMGKLGITTRFFDIDDPDAARALITPRTRVIFAEMVGNPNANVADIEKLAAIARDAGLPLVMDATFTTPYLFRPLEWGADVVVHSATKYLCGNATAMGGIVVDGGSFNFKGSARFADFNRPDPSYHGVVYANCSPSPLCMKLRAETLRDYGACLAPMNAFLTTMGLETLSLRMRRHSDSALELARFLEGHPKVERVHHPGLESSKYRPLAEKYLPLGCGGVFTFEIKGGRAAGESFLNALDLFAIVSNVGDTRSMVVHPASTTHSQLTDDQLKASGITAGTVRVSVGLEDTADLMRDLEEALG